MSKQRREYEGTQQRHATEATLRRSLAYLDGDADGAPAAQDGDAEALVPRIAELRRSLAALPDSEAPPDVWREVERRRSTTLSALAHRPPYFRWFALAGGAVAAFVIVALGIRTATAPAGRVAPAGVATSVVESSPQHALSVLVAESQRLERSLALERTLRSPMTFDADDTDEWHSSRRALVYRLSDLDDELTSVSLTPHQDPERAEALWRRRVELMQSLGELERAEQWHTYRTVVF